MQWCGWRGCIRLIGGDAHGGWSLQKGTLRRDCIQISVETAEHGPVKGAWNVPMCVCVCVCVCWISILNFLHFLV